jgi:zinc protease
MKRSSSRLVPGPVLHLALAAFMTLTASVAVAAPLDATRVTLANGLRVVLAPDMSALGVDAALWFPAGTRNERPAQPGLALLAARLGFRNGADDPLKPLVAAGGNGNLAATPDYVSFAATVPVEELGTALDFLAARLPGVPVTPAALASERVALKAEQARAPRPPVTRALAKLWASAWPGHPYAKTGSAPGASDALTPADLETWRRARFAPGSAVLTVAGAFEPESALAQIRARFEKRPRGTPATPSNLAVPRVSGRGVERFDVPARLCLIGWRGPGAGDPDVAACELLATWLGGGAQAKLGNSLVRDWQLAVATQAGFSAQRDGSLLWTLAVVPPGVDSTAVERTLLDAAMSATRQAPEAFELERARRQLGSSSAFGLQTVRQRSQALGEAEMLAGDATAASRRLAALDRVTPDDLRRVATRLMTESARATVWILPAAGGAR